MTSDSEADYKFAGTNNIPIKTSVCPEGELRCINGTCITLSQLCDKVIFFEKTNNVSLHTIQIYFDNV